MKEGLTLRPLAAVYITQRKKEDGRLSPGLAINNQ